MSPGPLVRPGSKDLGVGEMLGSDVTLLLLPPDKVLGVARDFTRGCEMVGLTVGGDVTWPFIISSFSWSLERPERSEVLLLLVSVTPSPSPKLDTLSQFSPSLRSSF